MNSCDCDSCDSQVQLSEYISKQMQNADTAEMQSTRDVRAQPRNKQ